MMRLVADNTKLEPEIIEVTSGWKALWYRVCYEVWYYRLRLWLPRLVWVNDEVDVCITFTQHSLNPETSTEAEALKQLFSGKVYEIEKLMRQLGIGFDTGMGYNGRDWEWDWSLSGPISVRFRGRSKTSEKRKPIEAPPEPKLVA